MARVLMPAEMERWRCFFSQGEADLWTIINQAILLAAADFPAEFKHKRCEIAEILFARRPCLSRSMEATVLSGSVITNSTADGERKGPHQTCREDDIGISHMHASRGEVKAADTQSLSTVSKPSAAERHMLHDDKSVELDTCLRNCNDPKDFPEAAYDLPMDHTILQNVSMIKDQIMDLANQSEDGLLRSLRALEHLDINVEILKATDIGREVNKFRKHSSGPVRSLVKQLVRTWKGMVDEWVRNAAIVHPLNASGKHEIVNEEVKHVNSQTEASAQRSLQLSKHLSAAEHERFETVKRRLPLEEQHVERAKKQRDMPPSTSLELSKRGFLSARLPACAKSQHCI